MCLSKIDKKKLKIKFEVNQIHEKLLKPLRTCIDVILAIDGDVKLHLSLLHLYSVERSFTNFR